MFFHTLVRAFYFMDIICKKCGSVNDYKTELKNSQNVAHCNGCGKFIKNIPYQKPKMYFGKYKDKFISDITDINYLDWVLRQNIVKGNNKQAIIDQLFKLNSHVK